MHTGNRTSRETKLVILTIVKDFQEMNRREGIETSRYCKCWINENSTGVRGMPANSRPWAKYCKNNLNNIHG